MTARAPRRYGSWFAIGLLVLGLGLLVAGSAQAAERELAITEDKAQPSESWEAFDTDPIELHDFNGDGVKEIVAMNDNGWVYVFDSQDGDLLFEAETTIPSHWDARSFNGPEGAIVDEGGTQKIVVTNAAAVVASFRFDPAASSANDFVFDREWEQRLNTCYDDPGMDAKPVLADLDQDGTFEILLTTEELGFYVLNQDGTTMWKNCVGGGNAPPAVADVNRDGTPDIIYANDAGLVVAYDGPTGAWLWSYDIEKHYDLGTPSIPASPAVGQIDGSGGPDVVVGARDIHDPDNWDANHALLLALDEDGNELWGFQDPQGNPLTYTTPIIEDANDDGTNEIYWADWNTIGHKPPTGDDAWSRTGPAHFYRLNLDGTVAWRTTIDTWWQNKDIPLADVDGDGTQEMLANGPTSDDTEDGIYHLDTRDGSRERFVSTYPWKVKRAPVLADMWGQGTMQWAMAAAPQTSDVGHAILVYDTGSAYDAAWPAMPEYQLGSGGSQTDTSGETFGASFRIKSPNEWWQELYVEPDEPRDITRAEVRIDGGDWQPMDESDWGAWTSSYHAPEGSQVAFRVHDSSGAHSVSETFTWLSGEDTKDDRHDGSDGSSDTSSGSSGDLSASFDPGSGSNEWWIEVYVDADESLQGVDVQINGGDWRPLEHKDWGAWAASYHAPAGSEVVFRATSTDGDQATSQSYAWLGQESSSSDGFDPGFDVGDEGNEWWIEVYIESPHSIQAVDTRIDGGSWQPLEKKSWGGWAESYHAPDGSQVAFRATNADGDTATSSTYTWPP